MTIGPLCPPCPLKPIGSGFIREDGDGRATGVLVVAEAPGETEVAEGKILVGTAGKFWTRIVNRTEDPLTGKPFNKADFKYANVLCCRPPNNILSGAPYEHSALAHCRPYLEDLINRFKPKCILALGNQPLRWFTGLWGIEKLRGYIHKTKYGPVIGTFHPSHLVRSAGTKKGGEGGKVFLSPAVQVDLLKAVNVARNGIPSIPPRNYILNPSPQEAERFYAEYVAAGFPLLSFDIETPRGTLRTNKDDVLDRLSLRIEDDASYSCIYRISFSFAPHSGITFAWQPPFIEIARRLLASSGEKCAFNAPFDLSRLAHHGAPVSGRVFDVMQCWHWLEPALPMSLAFVAPFFCPEIEPWKLEAESRPEYYNLMDSDIALRCMNGVRARLQAQGRWEAMLWQVVETTNVLREMSRIGVAVDQEKRRISRDLFTMRAVAEVEALQAHIPKVLRKKKIYTFSDALMEKKGLRANGEWVEVEVQILLKPGYHVVEGKMVKIPKVKKERKKREPKCKKGRTQGRKRSSLPVEMVREDASQSDRLFDGAAEPKSRMQPLRVDLPREAG